MSLLEPFEYQYMIKAIWVSGLIGVVCGFLSCFITLKGWSLLGDALSHAVVPGVAIAGLLGWPFAAGAFIAGLLAAGGMALIKAKSPLREDAVIGVIFTTFFAVGLLILSIFPSGMSIQSIIFGNILGISDDDIRQVIVISVASLLLLSIKWRDLMLYCFDAAQAHAIGLKPRLMHLILLILLSATAVAALQTVGASLVVAMLVTPGATAYQLTDRFGRMILISCLIGGSCGLVGAYVSYFFNGSTGGCIVVLLTFIFLLTFYLAPKYGRLALWKANRRQPRLAA